jgi:branched-chain amino acid transport system permease protein
MAAVRSLVQSAFPLLVPAALVTTVTAAVYAVGDELIVRVATVALMNLVIVIGLYVFVGNSGVFSFGHVAFAAIGAYTAAILVVPPTSEDGVTGKDILLSDLPGFLLRAHTGPLLATLIGGLVAAALAAVISLPLMRLSGIAASIATFSLLLIVNVVASNWRSVTNGTGGIAGVPTSTTAWVALCWALVAMGAAFLFQQTRFCLRLRASREDEVAARGSGIGVFPERRLAFVLSAFVVGVGGGLYGQYLGSFSPGAFYLPLTFVTVAMLVIGGVTSLAGAVLGTVFVATISEVFRRVEEAVDVSALSQIGLAVVMLLVLTLRPGGLTGGAEVRLPRRPRRQARGDDAEQVRISP